VGALLCVAPLDVAAEQGAEALGLKGDASFYYYGELGRISTFGPFFSGSWEPSPSRLISVQASVDVITGASPNGARKLPIPQTFSTASGGSVYHTAADETPLAAFKREGRIAGQLGYTERFGSNHSLALGIGGSTERDYKSTRGTIGWSSELGRRNTTLDVQLRYEHAWIEPNGGVPVALSLMAADKLTEGDSAAKDVVGASVAVTQVLSRTTLAQWGYSVQGDLGYLSDPYKVVTRVSNGDTVPADLAYVYESRPESRWRHAFAVTVIQESRPVTFRGGYRLYLDGWGVVTHTGNTGLRVAIGESVHLSATARGSFQSKADFYTYDLEPGRTVDHASADYRLGDLATVSGFLGGGVMLAEAHELRVRAGPMHQFPLADGRFPSVTALIGHLSYVGEW